MSYNYITLMNPGTVALKSKANFDTILVLEGRLAQLARASRLHREGRGFESLSAHHRKKTLIWVSFFYGARGMRTHGGGSDYCQIY